MSFDSATPLLGNLIAQLAGQVAAPARTKPRRRAMPPLIAMQLGLMAPYPCTAPDSVRRVHVAEPPAHKLPDPPPPLPARPAGVRERTWERMQCAHRELIEQGPSRRADLSDALGIDEETLATCLYTMRDLGMVEMERAGKYVYWAATSEGVE